MKKLFILPLSLLMIAALLNHSAGSGTLSGTTFSNSDAEPATARAGKGTITCLIDGKQKVFTVQQSFFEISLDPYSKGQTDGIEILDGNSKKEGFQFEFKKNGKTKIKSDAAGDMNCIINYYNPEGVTYTGGDVTVDVISYNQQQLNGTFSGKLVNVYFEEGSNNAKNYPQFIELTNGKFDLHK